MEKGFRMRMSVLAVLAACFVLALGGTALAQDNPTTDAYGGVLGNEVENSGDTTANVQEVGGESSSGSLPFTGMQVGLVALVGIGLVSLGFAMRRGTRRPPAA
ncbi:MAG TPA: hypothetical protein VFM58_01075 [Solirubrobacteraceae bacterium]|jgi:hypothetical protein|nr:hypothetical protein [Solirubrobacteraceae bacterium]